MKKFLSILWEQLNVFLGNAQSPVPQEEDDSSPYLDIIQLALYKKAAVHVIYADKSFTGEIVHFDADKERMILKNFKKNITSIISLKDIQRISLVPESIQQAQKQT